METRKDYLEPDFYYHIFNRGINGARIFETAENYFYFLKRLKFFLFPVCEFYAYCLMPNYFHFVVRIKSEEEIKAFSEKNKIKNVFFENGLHSYDSIISKQFARFISSYSQAYNKFDKSRTGALLESPFKRIRISDDEYLRKLIIYVHQNPKSLGNNLEDYLFSSYRSLISDHETSLKRKEVFEIFDGRENFVSQHQKELDLI